VPVDPVPEGGLALGAGVGVGVGVDVTVGVGVDRTLTTGVRGRMTETTRTAGTLRVGALAGTVVARAARCVVGGLSRGSAETPTSPTTTGCGLAADVVVTLASTTAPCPGARSGARLGLERELAWSTQAPANNTIHTSPVVTVAPRPHDVPRTNFTRYPLPAPPRTRIIPALTGDARKASRELLAAFGRRR
jgi:hypothetical protein